MKQAQRIIIALIIVAPVLIGILLALPHGSATSPTISSVGFKKLGLVELTGVIYESETTIRQLQELRDDNSIVGVILRVDSPGGATAPSQEIYKAVLDFTVGDDPVRRRRSRLVRQPRGRRHRDERQGAPEVLLLRPLRAPRGAVSAGAVRR